MWKISVAVNQQVVLLGQTCYWIVSYTATA